MAYMNANVRSEELLGTKKRHHHGNGTPAISPVNLMIGFRFSLYFFKYC
jgi:hypothetical protein